MSARETLEKLIENMPEERVREVADFAAFLSWQEERAALRHFARAYGDDEPDYTLADLKRDYVRP